MTCRPGRASRLVSVLLAGVALAGCGGTSAPGPVDVAGHGQGGGPGTTASDVGTGLTRWAPGDRPRLPALAGRTLDGGRLDLRDWRGHVVVVNTWGSWCAPCRKEAPDLARVAAETAPAGVRFVGIDTRDNDAAARAFVREFGIGYPSLVDDDGRLMLAFGRTIPVSAVPTTVVADRRHRIAARVIGAVTAATLRGLIEDTLAEPHAAGAT